jgi:hypothetical protein
MGGTEAGNQAETDQMGVVREGRKRVAETLEQRPTERRETQGDGHEEQ